MFGPQANLGRGDLDISGQYNCVSRSVAGLVDRENASKRVIVDDEEEKRNE